MTKEAKTIFWNGPMGVFETKPFDAGTMGVARLLAESAAFTVVGGGESVEAVHAAGVAREDLARLDRRRRLARPHQRNEAPGRRGLALPGAARPGPAPPRERRSHEARRSLVVGNWKMNKTPVGGRGVRRRRSCTRLAVAPRRRSTSRSRPPSRPSSGSERRSPDTRDRPRRPGRPRRDEGGLHRRGLRRDAQGPRRRAWPSSATASAGADRQGDRGRLLARR